VQTVLEMSAYQWSVYFYVGNGKQQTGEYDL